MPRLYFVAVPLMPLLLLAATGCIRVAGSVAKPTALERQLLGEYEQLDDELIWASSVRGTADPLAPSFDVLKAQAVEQRGLQRFNEDDVVELKKERCLAESLEGTLVSRPCPLVQADQAISTRVERVVREENKARSTILLWAAYELARKEGRSTPGPKELDEIKKAYARLLRAAAQPGQLAEVAPGEYRDVEGVAAPK